MRTTKSKPRQSAARVVCAAGVVLAAGCTQVETVYLPQPSPAPMQPLEVAALQGPETASTTDGSLWTSDSVSWFSDDKAMRRGDVVLVQVIQRSTGTKNANTDTSRESSISATIKWLLGLEDEVNSLTGYSAANPDRQDGSWNPNELVSASGANEFKGSGETAREDRLEATVSAVIVDVLRNGNLVIYGHQTVTLNNEASVLTVQGVVKPSDITSDNTVDSTRIANANIEFTGSGILTDKQHPGWGTRVFDWVWPF